MRFIDGLRHERESPTAAYHQFLLNASKFPRDVHAFFEGQDDASFYTNFLRRFTSNPEGVHTYRCGNKRGVYEAHSKVKNIRREERALFFVDKDLSDILNEDWEDASNIYVTDYYSIENYLVSEDTLFRVWTELFHFMNVTLDFSEIHLEKFQKELERFYQLVLPITAWIVYLRREEKRPNVNNISFPRFFYFGNDLTLQKSEELKQLGEIKLLEQICREERPAGWLEESPTIMKELSALTPKTYIKGKLELCFFLRFVEKLRRVLDDSISGSGRVGVRTQLTEDNAIEILGPRLIIPHTLEEFLRRNLTRE
jgi:hypothetical protein